MENGALIDKFASLTSVIRYRACFAAKSLRHARSLSGPGSFDIRNYTMYIGHRCAKGKVTVGKNAISAPSRLTNLVQIPAQTGAWDETRVRGHLRRGNPG